MKSYRTTRPAVLLAGQIMVSEKQAGVRQHCLQRVGGGVFLIIGACCFKAGEVIGLDVSDQVATSLGLELAADEQPVEPQVDAAPIKPKRRGRKPA